MPAALPIYGVERQNGMMQSRTKIVEQITNLQELAEYQTTLFGYAAAARVE
jgi:hypothetical protein